MLPMFAKLLLERDPKVSAAMAASASDESVRAGSGTVVAADAAEQAAGRAAREVRLRRRQLHAVRDELQGPRRRPASPSVGSPSKSFGTSGFHALNCSVFSLFSRFAHVFHTFFARRGGPTLNNDKLRIFAAIDARCAERRPRSTCASACSAFQCR